MVLCSLLYFLIFVLVFFICSLFQGVRVTYKYLFQKLFLCESHLNLGGQDGCCRVTIGRHKEEKVDPMGGAAQIKKRSVTMEQPYRSRGSQVYLLFSTNAFSSRLQEHPR